MNNSNNDSINSDLEAYAEKNGQYYAQFLKRSEHSKTFLSWNWSAFFFLPFWLAYRKLWIPFAVIVGLQCLLTLLISKAIYSLVNRNIYQDFEFGFLVLFAALLLASLIAIGIVLLANSLYLRRAQKVIKQSKFAANKTLQGTGRSVVACTLSVILFALSGIFVSWYQARHLDAFEETTLSIENKNIESETSEAKNQLSDVMLSLETALGNITYYESEYQTEFNLLLDSHTDISSLNQSQSLVNIVERLMQFEDVDSLKRLHAKKIDLMTLEKHFDLDFLAWIQGKNFWKVAKFLQQDVNYKIDSEFLMQANGYNEERPLQYAIKNEDIEAVTWMLEQTVPVKAKYFSGESPLLLAVKTKNLQVVDLLLARGADPRYKNLRGESALSVASELNLIEIVNRLESK